MPLGYIYILSLVRVKCIHPSTHSPHTLYFIWWPSAICMPKPESPGKTRWSLGNFSFRVSEHWNIKPNYDFRKRIDEATWAIRYLFGVRFFFLFLLLLLSVFAGREEHFRLSNCLNWGQTVTLIIISTADRMLGLYYTLGKRWEFDRNIYIYIFPSPK